MEMVTGKLRVNTLVDGDGIGDGVGMCKQTFIVFSFTLLLPW